jgi:hypothetical protein
MKGNEDLMEDTGGNRTRRGASNGPNAIAVTVVKVPNQAPSSGAGWETYAIAIIYVPFLMITLVLAFYLQVRPQPNAVAESGLLRNEPTEV